MARDAVTITDVPLNSSVDEPAGTTIVVANGAVIDAGHTDGLMLIIRNTDSSDRVATIKAGVGPTKDLGDLTITVPAATDVVFTVLESARFAQADGKINVDFAASFAGTIAAIRLPKSV